MDTPGIRSAVIHRRTRTAIAEFSPRRGRLHKTWPPDQMRVVEGDAGDGVSQAFVPEAAGSWCKTIAVRASEFVRRIQSMVRWLPTGGGCIQGSRRSRSSCLPVSCRVALPALPFLSTIFILDLRPFSNSARYPNVYKPSISQPFHASTSADNSTAIFIAPSTKYSR